jgi:hypothetical protein
MSGRYAPTLLEFVAEPFDQITRGTDTGMPRGLFGSIGLMAGIQNR